MLSAARLVTVKPGLPWVVNIFALCAFALGFTEFIAIALVAVMAADLHSSLSQAGLAITTYALGAVLGAPILTALASSWPRKRLLLVVMTLFSLGNILVALSASLSLMLLARFASGLSHGVFLAVASTVAAQLVPPERAGAAVARVFMGLTLALALGVPLGSYLASLWSWQLIFVAIACCGAAGVVGLWYGMPADRLSTVVAPDRVLAGLKALCHPRLLAGAGITVLAYAGAFTLYSYIAPLLSQVTQLSEAGIAAVLLLYGVMAALGNAWGGYLADRRGADQAVLVVLLGLTVVLCLIWWGAANWLAMSLLVGLLGALSYAAVPTLQARIIGLSARYAAEVPAVAAGLNIAGFNAGIALGSILGGGVLTQLSLASMAWVGAAVVGLGIGCLGWQRWRWK